MTLDFDRLAANYDRLRPAGEAWRELAEHTLAGMRGCRRLLDVGCGTGRFAVLAHARLGGKVWGVDPSAEMLRRARSRPDARGIGWKQGAAERLPFRDAWFDAGHMHLVVHTLADRAAAVGELARVLGPAGRLAIATFAPEHFDRFFLNPYFPSLADIDRARFPDPAALAADVTAAGFADVAWSGSASRSGQSRTMCSSACAAATSRRCTCSIRASTPRAWPSSSARWGRVAGPSTTRSSGRCSRPLDLTADSPPPAVHKGARHLHARRIARMPSAKAAPPPFAGWRT